MNDITISFDGQSFELGDFELGDLEWLEDFIGAPLSEEGAMNRMKTAVGFVYLIKRRDDPTFTVDKARLTKLSVFVEPDETDEPEGKPAATKRPPKRAARS